MCFRACFKIVETFSRTDHFWRITIGHSVLLIVCRLVNTHTCPGFNVVCWKADLLIFTCFYHYQPWNYFKNGNRYNVYLSQLTTWNKYRFFFFFWRSIARHLFWTCCAFPKSLKYHQNKLKMNITTTEMSKPNQLPFLQECPILSLAHKALLGHPLRRAQLKLLSLTPTAKVRAGSWDCPASSSFPSALPSLLREPFLWLPLWQTAQHRGRGPDTKVQGLQNVSP